MKIEVLSNFINNLSFNKSEDRLRMDLYALLSTLILSKEIFKRNSDVKDFLSEKLDITFMDYVYLSRTQIIARTLRRVDSMEDKELIKNLITLKDFINDDISNKISVSPDYRHKRMISKNENLVNKFSRNRK